MGKKLVVSEARLAANRANAQLAGRPTHAKNRFTERTRRKALDELRNYELPSGETLLQAANKTLGYLISEKQDAETTRWFFNQDMGTPTSRVELVQFPEAESLKQMAWAVYDGIHIQDEDDDFFLTDEQKDKLYKRCIRLFVDRIDPETLPNLGGSS